MIVPLAQLGTGSYLPPVAFVTAGTLILLQGLLMITGTSGLYLGLTAAFGIISTYLLISIPVILIGEWIKQYLLPLQLLAGPLIIALGVLYYTGRRLPVVVSLPERTGRSTGAFFSFGVLYGLGSLACNLPLFLGIILSVFRLCNGQYHRRSHRLWSVCNRHEHAHGRCKRTHCGDWTRLLARSVRASRSYSWQCRVRPHRELRHAVYTHCIRLSLIHSEYTAASGSYLIPIVGGRPAAVRTLPERGRLGRTRFGVLRGQNRCR